MATVINIYDYTEADPYWGFEEQFCIGYGNLTAAVINQQIDDATGDLEVHINTAGGKVFDGWAIYNKLNTYDRGTVTVYIDGLAASIGSVIAMAGQTVIMGKASMIMVHKATGFYIGSMNADQLAAEAQALNEVEAVIASIYVEKTGLPLDKVQSMINAATWLSPDTAVSLGFADEIQQSASTPSIPQNVFDRLFENASDGARTYANAAFTITNNKNMSNSNSVKELVEKQDKTNSLLTDFLNFIGLPKKNEIESPAAPVEEPKDDDDQDKAKDDDGVTEPTMEELKAENEKLKGQIAADKDKVNNAQSILDQANELHNEMQNTLAEVRSNYQPKSGGESFDSGKPSEEGDKFNKQELEDRKKQYKTKK